MPVRFWEFDKYVLAAEMAARCRQAAYAEINSVAYVPFNILKAEIEL